MIEPLVPAMALALARVFMPRRWALSEWKRRPKLASTKLPVALEFGTMVPGRPSLL